MFAFVVVTEALNETAILALSLLNFLSPRIGLLSWPHYFPLFSQTVKIKRACAYALQVARQIALLLSTQYIVQL